MAYRVCERCLHRCHTGMLSTTPAAASARVATSFNALNFDTFAGQFWEIVFVKLLARRAASRSLLEAAGVDVSCSSTDKACVATGVDAEDDDELVPYIAAIVVLGVLIAGVVIGTVMYAAKKKSDGNVAEMANAPAYG